MLTVQLPSHGGVEFYFKGMCVYQEHPISNGTMQNHDLTTKICSHNYLVVDCGVDYLVCEARRQ
jgi:hypothetical protein